MSGLDPNCAFCGRPIIGRSIYGIFGPYHPECTMPPQGTVEYASSWHIPIGCICPPGSEQTCGNATCPRKGMDHA